MTPEQKASYVLGCPGPKPAVQIEHDRLLQERPACDAAVPSPGALS